MLLACIFLFIYLDIHAAPLSLGDVTCLMTIIGRKGVREGGTLAFDFGCDEEGNCGSYVEVEQIVSLKDHLFSHVQVRASVPLNWTDSHQPRLSKLKLMSGNGSVLIYGENGVQESIIAKHFGWLYRAHERIHVVDLLTTQGSEGELREVYTSLLQKIASENLR